MFCRGLSSTLLLALNTVTPAVGSPNTAAPMVTDVLVSLHLREAKQGRKRWHGSCSKVRHA